MCSLVLAELVLVLRFPAETLERTLCMSRQTETLARDEGSCPLQLPGTYLSPEAEATQAWGLERLLGWFRGGF